MLPSRSLQKVGYCLISDSFRTELTIFRFLRYLGLPFYQDKLHEETVYKRFGEILTKVS
jgi:condensin complex subunit 1